MRRVGGKEVESQNSHVVVRAPPLESVRENRVSVEGCERQWRDRTASKPCEEQGLCRCNSNLVSIHYLLKFVLFHLISFNISEVSVCHCGCEFAGTAVEQDSVNGVNSFSTMKGTLGI